MSNLNKPNWIPRSVNGLPPSSTGSPVYCGAIYVITIIWLYCVWKHRQLLARGVCYRRSFYIQHTLITQAINNFLYIDFVLSRLRVHLCRGLARNPFYTITSMILAQHLYSCILASIDSLSPRQNDRHFQTTFSNLFSGVQMYKFRLSFHRNLFLGVQLKIMQPWIR